MKIPRLPARDDTKLVGPWRAVPPSAEPLSSA